jgi:hypothetical protein
VLGGDENSVRILSADNGILGRGLGFPRRASGLLVGSLGIDDGAVFVDI